LRADAKLKFAVLNTPVFSGVIHILVGEAILENRKECRKDTIYKFRGLEIGLM
jgi:hypothetical protein